MPIIFNTIYTPYLYLYMRLDTYDIYVILQIQLVIVIYPLLSDILAIMQEGEKSIDKGREFWDPSVFPQ